MCVQVGLVMARVTAAQSPEQVGQAAATRITPATLQREIVPLTVDSLWDRTTPSAALERTAHYLAAALQSLDTTAHNRRAPTLHWYPVPGRTVHVRPESSWLHVVYQIRVGQRPVVTESGAPAKRSIRVSFLTDARFAVPLVPEQTPQERYAPPLVLLTGRPTPAFLQKASLADKSVLYIPPADLDSATRQVIFNDLYAASKGVAVLSLADTADFAVSPEKMTQQALQVVDAYLQDLDGDTDDPRPWVVEFRAAAVVELLVQLGVDVASARLARTPVLREVPGLRVWLKHKFLRPDVFAMDTVPNVVQLLPGSDRAWARQCVVITAPLDQRGPRPHGSAGVRGLADASTVSLAAMLALARAFTAPGGRPKRSILLLATSGGAPDQLVWGSHAYLHAMMEEGRSKICRPVLNLAIDFTQGGAGSGDTIIFSGVDHVELAQPPALVAALHPELGLAVVEAETSTSRSDNWAFGRRAYPNLLVHGSAGSLSGLPYDAQISSTGFDLARTTRWLQLVFYLIQSAANTELPPRWNAVGRRHMLDHTGLLRAP